MPFPSNLETRYSFNLALLAAGAKPHQIPSPHHRINHPPLRTATTLAEAPVGSLKNVDSFENASRPMAAKRNHRTALTVPETTSAGVESPVVFKQNSALSSPCLSSRNVDDRSTVPKSPRFREGKTSRELAARQSQSSSPIPISHSHPEQPKELTLPESVLEDAPSIVEGDHPANSKEGMPGRVLSGKNESLSHLNPSRSEDKRILDALLCRDLETWNSLQRKISIIHDTIQKTQASKLEEEYSEEFIKRYRAFLELPKGSKEAIDAAKKLHIDICRVYEKHYTPDAMKYGRKKKDNLLSLLIGFQQQMAEDQSKEQNKIVKLEDIATQAVLLKVKEMMLGSIDTAHRDNPKAFEGPEKTWQEMRGEYDKLESFNALSHLYDLIRIITQDSHTPPIVTERWHNPTVNPGTPFTSIKADSNSIVVPENKFLLNKRSTFPSLKTVSPLRTNSMPSDDSGSKSFFPTEEEKEYEKAKREYLISMRTVRIWDGEELKSSAEPWQELHDEQRQYYIDVLRPSLLKVGDEDSADLINQWGRSQHRVVEGSAWQVDQEVNVLRDANKKLFGKSDFEYRH